VFKRRLFSLALVVSLLASLTASLPLAASASSEKPGQNAIFFPFVYNGTTIDGHAGTFSGQLTVQNMENWPVNVSIMSAGFSSYSGFGAVRINPRASITLSASQLGVASGGEGVIATASWADPKMMADLGVASLTTYTFAARTRTARTSRSSTSSPAALRCRAIARGRTIP
jgi:hypothetical protein